MERSSKDRSRYSVIASKLARNPPARSPMTSSKTVGPTRAARQAVAPTSRGGRGREAEASARDRHLEGFVTQATAEMVHLVDDEKVEATSDLLHVPIRPFEGRHRDRRHLADAVAIASD